jgi:hypothetical protein
MTKKKNLIWYYIKPFDTGVKWYHWVFRTFNLKFKNTYYNEKGFRLFGFTFIWLE